MSSENEMWAVGEEVLHDGPPAPRSGSDPVARLDESCLAIDPQAQEFFAREGADTVGKCVGIANILHAHRHVREASEFYRRACDLHDRSPGLTPSAHWLLQARLLCLLKAGMTPPDAELSELRALCIPYADYIEGVRKAWQGGDVFDAVRTIGNAYEEFHTGEEIDSILLGLVHRGMPGIFNGKPAGRNVSIPRKLFFYREKQDLPPQVAENLGRYKDIRDLEIHVFNRDEAAEWLYTYYGVEARSLFLEARHPGEAADFLRVHVINLLGGWWLDANLRLRLAAFRTLMDTPDRNGVYFLTDHDVIRNDFFGSTPNSEILGDCIFSLYRNSYLHKDFPVAGRTGPGIFGRAMNRLINRRLNGIISHEMIAVLDHVQFRNVIEAVDPPHNADLRS